MASPARPRSSHTPGGDPVLHFRDLLNPAGALTLLRLPLAVAAPFFKHDRVAMLVILTLAALSDVLDGVVARRTGTSSRTGAVVDGWVDKIFLVNFAWSMELAGYVRGLHLLAWFGREIIQGITIPALAWRYRVGNAPWPEHSRVGKAATVSIGLAMYAGLLGVDFVRDAATVVGGALGLASAIGYLRRDTPFKADTEAEPAEPTDSR